MQSKTTESNLSIAICTYNRSDQLRQTLDSLVAIQSELVAGDEIIVVDNNSHDDTVSAVDHYKALLPIKYQFEKKQGLSAARNRAIASFTAPFIVFFDDDITVMPGCITTFRQAAMQTQEASFFGGKLHVDCINGKPDWLKSYELPMLNGLLGHYDLGSELRDADVITYPPQERLPYGACFALRRELIDAVGKFDEQLGVKGKAIGRGEETDYFERAIALNFVGQYLSDAFVLHRFPLDRLKLSHLLKYGMQKGVVASPVSPLNSVINMADQLCKGVFQLLKGRRDRFYQCIINVGLYRGKASGENHTKRNSIQ